MSSDQVPQSKARRFFRLFLRISGALAALLALVVLAGVGAAWTAMGTAPEGKRLERMQSSPRWSDGVFANEQPLWNNISGSLSSPRSDYGSPQNPVPVQTGALEKLSTPPTPGDVRVTWLGHSTTIVEIEGARILIDPVFGEHTSPLPVGPSRWYEPLIALEDIKDVDAILISHDHYDHLDYPTIAAMKDKVPLFIAPLGVGAHLEYWGVPQERIVELDWWEEKRVKDLRIVATPSRHASGRHILDQNRTLWAGYALVGAQKRVMYSGDTGLFDGMAEIGEKLGPFDLVMVEVGAYDQAWPDWHLGPEQAVRATQMMRGKLMLPVHWGLFNLANHGWTEPIERTLVAAETAGVAITTPQPGDVFEVSKAPPVHKWWPDVPWDSAEVHPIVATKKGDPSERYPAKLKKTPSP